MEEEEREGRKPFNFLKTYELDFADSGTPGRTRTKGVMAGLGEEGVRVIMIRSLPAGLARGWEE